MRRLLVGRNRGPARLAATIGYDLCLDGKGLNLVLGPVWMVVRLPFIGLMPRGIAWVPRPSANLRMRSHWRQLVGAWWVCGPKSRWPGHEAPT